ncbi:MAG: P1 family peptidase, partial [Dehalococcoidia bacterium]|nr:P1 family peptidase [Dehalococcoidia bacterium]
LEEKGVGYEMAGIKVPIVPAAVVFDLDIGSAKIRPGIAEGYQACVNAGSGKMDEGCVGAGTGAMIGQLMGKERATKSGLGTASIKIFGNVIVAAIFSVNAMGDVIDPDTGHVLAGIRNEDGTGFADTVELLKRGYTFLTKPGANTVIGIVATNVSLTKAQATKVAGMAHDGMARAINPTHTMLDGDTIFALSLGLEKCDVTTVGAMAAEVTQQAIIRAARQATSLDSVPCLNDVLRP